jgi:tRNA threonylcarbamoyladenosine biosynthesis protein TsaE
MNKTILLKSETDTQALAKELAEMNLNGSVWLSGDLGAGKTSLARGLLAELGLMDEAPSPSFALVIPYAPPQVRLPVWHVDLYRLNDPAEAEELGLEDALFDGALLIEWPERLNWLWPETLALHISVSPDGTRGLTAKVPPSWKDRWPLS